MIVLAKKVGAPGWFSPDWADKPISVPYAEFGDPQSLNLYDYVRNNPMSKADADGHDALWVVDNKTGKVTLVIPIHITGKGLGGRPHPRL